MILLAANLPHAIAADITDTLRVGFSSRMFFEVNENDAKAAVKVWGRAFTKAQNIPTDPEPFVYDQFSAIQQSLANRQVDAVGLSLTEFEQLNRQIELDPIFVTYVAGKPTEQYLLLARRDGPIKTLADLHGRTLRLQTNLRATLAPMWLDVALVQHGHPIASLHASKITSESKLTKVVLPVFFRQSDACLVTRTGFETMSELNPQIGKQLAVVDSSPEFVPAIFALRADYQPTFRARIIEGLRHLHESPGGQQILNIFQSDAIELQPRSFLDASLELLKTHARICGTEASTP